MAAKKKETKTRANMIPKKHPKIKKNQPKITKNHENQMRSLVAAKSHGWPPKEEDWSPPLTKTKANTLKSLVDSFYPILIKWAVVIQV